MVVLRQVSDDRRHAVNQVRDVGRLLRRAVDAQLDATARGMADLGRRGDVAEYRRLLEVLADVPGPLLFLRRGLQIAAGHVQSAGVAEHVIERTRIIDAEAGLTDR